MMQLAAKQQAHRIGVPVLRYGTGALLYAVYFISSSVRRRISGAMRSRSFFSTRLYKG